MVSCKAAKGEATKTYVRVRCGSLARRPTKQMAVRRPRAVRRGERRMVSCEAAKGEATKTYVRVRCGSRA